MNLCNEGGVKYIPSTLLLVLSCLPALACANAKSSFLGVGDGGASGDGGGIDGGAGEGGVGGSDCPGFCALAAAKGIACDDTAKCITSCKAGKKTATTADCGDEWQALVDCAMGPGTGGKKPLITCTSTGKADIANCNSAKTALADCVSAPPPIVEDGGPPPGSCTLTEPFDPSVTACNTCVEQNCCDVTNTCTGSTDCVAMVDCMSACPAGGTTCINSCRTAHPTGAPQVQALSNCLNANCATPCR